MRLAIRLIKRADDPQVAALIRAVMPEFGAKGPGFAILDPEVDAMSASYDDPRSVYYVVVDTEDGGRVVGGGGVARLAGGDEATCELRKMYFYPEVRGRGVGRELLARCLDAARARGYTRCYLETLTGMDAAQRLYASFGFRRLDAPLGATGHFGCDRWYALDLLDDAARGSSTQTPAAKPTSTPPSPPPSPPPSRRAREAAPRRWAATFDEANDHDPLVLEDCPDCGGRGAICVELEGVAELGTCPACSGVGTTGRTVHYYAAAPPLAAAVEVATDAEGRVTCPVCSQRFSTGDPLAWTGRRHRPCGTPLRPRP